MFPLYQLLPKNYVDKLSYYHFRYLLSNRITYYVCTHQETIIVLDLYMLLIPILLRVMQSLDSYLPSTIIGYQYRKLPLHLFSIHIDLNSFQLFCIRHHTTIKLDLKNLLIFQLSLKDLVRKPSLQLIKNFVLGIHIYYIWTGFLKVV